MNTGDAFDFDAFGEEFSHLESEASQLGSGGGRAPKWRDEVFNSVTAEHAEDCQNPTCPGEEEFNEKFGELVDRIVETQRETGLTVTYEGPRDSEGVIEDEGVFTLTFTAEFARNLVPLVEVAATQALQGKKIAEMMGLPIPDVGVNIDEVEHGLEWVNDFAEMMRFIAVGHAQAITEEA